MWALRMIGRDDRTQILKSFKKLMDLINSKIVYYLSCIDLETIFWNSYV
jgi:hypothetical protein